MGAQTVKRPDSFCMPGGRRYVLLHQFVKKTQKTPAREIEKAKRELADIIERGLKYE